MNYWQDRAIKSQDNITKRSTKEIEAQLTKYYQKTMETVISDFENTYNKILLAVEDGREPTPADLYKLDTYWQMQGQIKKELEKLGDNTLNVLSKNFIKQYQNIYLATAATDDLFFNMIDRKTAEQMINLIWCADGKSWSQRVWDNTAKLQQALNDHLVDSVITGKKTSQLKRILQDDFNVSFSRADAVVRTELAHIQTEAAKKRYEDSGVKKVQIWADKDERQCDVCGELHEKIFLVGEQVPVPAHPRCRCCIIPVIE